MKLKKIALAKRMDISRPTLDKYLNMPDAPQPDAKGRYEYGATVQFVEKKSASEVTLGKSNPDILELKKQDIYERVRGKRMENDRLEGGWVSVEEADARLIGMLDAIQNAFNEFHNILPPQLAGRDMPSISEVLKKSVDNVWRDLKKDHGTPEDKD